MSKLAIVRPRYPYRKQIKINYKAKFLTDPILNNEIEKKNQLKKYRKRLESTQVNLLNTILES
jgi:hypothetical protein